MKCLAFDLDGTLITAEQKQVYLLCAVARRYSISLDAVEVWRRKRQGESNKQLLKNLGISETVIEKIANSWLQHIESQYWLGYDSLFDDVFGVFEFFKSLDFDLILITARGNEYLMRQQIKRLGIFDFFSEVCCVLPDNVVSGKSKLLDFYGASAFFGDSESDFYASKEAGILFYGVSTGQRCKNYLLEKGVENVDHSLSDAAKRFLLDDI